MRQAPACAGRSAAGAARNFEIQMKTCNISNTDLVVSRIAYGCGMLNGTFEKEPPLEAKAIGVAVRVINTAVERGVTLFDHADVYGFGKCEEAFGEVLRRSAGLRNKIVIQTKCGARFPTDSNPGSPAYGDFSREHIVRAVEGSLRRLGTDRVDILLLHQPDLLVEPEEVARAFDELKESGKVRYFGVSNHTPFQIDLLRKYLRQPLVVNQVYISLAHAHFLADGTEHTLEFTQRMLEFRKQDMTLAKLASQLKKFHESYSAVSGTGTIDYCRLHGIQLQAYQPLRGELLSPSADATEKVKDSAHLLASIALGRGVTPSAIALAWLLMNGVLQMLTARKSPRQDVHRVRGPPPAPGGSTKYAWSNV